jgi:protocatechuate 3,4-dioxygenase beta subunit
VVTDDGVPIRDADVRLSGDLIREAKSDENGRYEITNLPAGRFTLTATKSGYSTALFMLGSSSPDPSLEVGEREAVERSITLTRGGVITGRVVDDFGEPVTDAEIRVERYVYGPGGRQLAQHAGSAPSAWITDDRGEYRVYGLQPGEYLVSARTRQFGAPVTPGGAGRERAEGLLPTYYPGTTRVADAQAVRVAAGQEVAAHFAATPGRLVRISGTAFNSSGQPARGMNVFLGVETSNSSGQINGGAVAADGSFNVANVPPGNYVLRIRVPGASPPGSEIASMPITLMTEDLTGLRITTRRGSTIKGRVEWQGDSPRPTNPVRITTRSAEWSPGPLAGESTITYLDPEAGTVRDDDTFVLDGIVGSVLFNSSPAPGWTLRSATFRGRDITITGVDAASLEGDTPVVITLTDKLTDLTGDVRDSQGRPVTNYVVVVLPQEPVAGMGASRVTRVVRSDQGGAFRVRGLLPGNYVAAAVPALESGREWDPAIQQTVREAGRAVTLGDGETLTLTLELQR